MKITEAFWEKRNLGVDAVECTVEKTDAAEKIVQILSGRKEQYLVVKVPVDRADLFFSLQNSGFQYVETLFRVNKNLRYGIKAPAVCAEMAKYLTYREACATETAALLEAIESGAIFSTDRIAVDPYFSRGVAGKRYANWIRDLLLSEQTHVLITKFKEEAIGFHIAKQKGTLCEAILGGLFPEYLDSGYGALNPYSLFLWASEHGMTRLVTHVSSNNLPILKINMLYACKISEACSVFIKHQ